MGGLWVGVSERASVRGCVCGGGEWRVGFEMSERNTWAFVSGLWVGGVELREVVSLGGGGEW